MAWSIMRIKSAWKDLRNGLARCVENVAEVRATPVRRAADGLRAAVPAIHTVDAQGSAAVEGAAGYLGPAGLGLQPHPLWPGTIAADKFLRGIYGDRYHTDGSALARTYAHSLASVPEKLHRIVAADMRGQPHGGIWLGDRSLLDLGHPAWSAATRGGTPRGWPAGSTWHDVQGVHDPNHRALLVGHDKSSGSSNVALHEFGHALDHALGRPSQAPAFTEVHARVLPLVQRASPVSVDYYAQPGIAGKQELFGESVAWFYNTEQPGSGFSWFDNTEQPKFFNSVAAGRHLTTYFQALEAELGITA
ncbi:anthrax toxin lethal factor-related metalloendopeptidase [Nocardia testacea]|uniref:anthrax toxin lethal factor-related metalloendopeptidase n=1 Tax=Nocardia testacea TaxID=248551 RepID=UPI0012F6A8E4|nr:hypothetical protein [Nocardia testacea]